jgi:hypothetical protein
MTRGAGIIKGRLCHAPQSVACLRARRPLLTSIHTRSPQSTHIPHYLPGRGGQRWVQVDGEEICLPNTHFSRQLDNNYPPVRVPLLTSRSMRRTTDAHA